MKKDNIKRFIVDLISKEKGKKEVRYRGGTSEGDASSLCAYMLVKYFEDSGYVVRQQHNPKNRITNFCVHERAGYDLQEAGNVVCYFTDKMDFSKFPEKIGGITLKFDIKEIE